MFPFPDTHLRVLILEREIALKRAERERRLDGAFERERTTVTSRRSTVIRSLVGRMTRAAHSLRRMKPLASA